jgi:pimeloyl-ACP methyl ester carboxylesterase
MADYVLVHGGNMTTETWNRFSSGPPVYTEDGRMGGRCWDDTAAALAAHGHHVLAPTLDDEHSSSLTDHIEQICALIIDRDLRDVILAGHSYGGMIITGTAARLADRIGHLVYIDAALPDPGQSLFDIFVAGGCDPLSFVGLEAAAPYLQKLQFDARLAREKIAAATTGWTYLELPPSHVPMASMPEELERILLAIGAEHG